MGNVMGQCLDPLAALRGVHGELAAGTAPGTKQDQRLLERLRVGSRPLLEATRWVAGDLLHGV
jgi:hypothetical protein